MESPRSILAIDTSPFGSSLALLPAIRALRAAYPKTLLVVAASPGICELLSATPFVDDSIELKTIKSHEPRYFDSLKRLAVLIRGARRYRFDLVLDFSPRLETQITARLILRSLTITPSRPSRVVEMLIGWAGMPRSATQFSSSNYANVLSQVGVELSETSLGVETPDEAHARFEQRLLKAGSRGGELLVFVHTSNPYDASSWPVGHLADVGKRLSDALDARVIAADEPSERAFTDIIGTLLPAGSLKLVEPSAFEFIAAIARSSLAITDQPMIAGIASELGTPVIEIADTVTNKFAGSAEHRVLKSSSRKRISADQVFDAACELIHKGRSSALFQRR